MKISVVIPTYNSAKVIGATLDSVLRQTAPPGEILILDDGSTDDTISLLNSYKPRITLLQQKNQGVAPSRNTLFQRATGDLIAFLDHDDLWHPRYLEMQRRRFEEYPNAAAFFSGHVDFSGYEEFKWPTDPAAGGDAPEVIQPLDFLKRYNETTGYFGSMSFCCVPKAVLAAIGSEPFRISGVDDSYFCTLLPLSGFVVYSPAPLVAYRILNEAQSANRLKSLRSWVAVFELLEDRYAKLPDKKMRRAFRMAFAAKRRRYGRLLMGAGDARQARSQFTKAMPHPGDFASLMKSIAVYLQSHLPSRMQPLWPAGSREAELANSPPNAQAPIAVQPSGR